MNPAVHVDPIGTILFPLVGLLFAAAGTRVPLIGWAKPVPFLVRNLSRPRRDVILIALAGPASNLLLAIARLGPDPVSWRGGWMPVRVRPSPTRAALGVSRASAWSRTSSWRCST